MLQFAGLSGDCNISHFITTRHGGASSGSYASFNPGVYTTDHPKRIQTNLQLLSDATGIPAGSIVAPHQVHGDVVRAIEACFPLLDPDDRRVYLEGVDALVTDVPGICVAVATADCVPVLLYAPDKKVVAAIHAGWRGTVQQLVVKTVRFMTDQYQASPASMLAGIGPAIGRDAFEVGDEVPNAFREAGIDLSQLLSRNPETGKAHIDLWEANRLQLLAAGVPTNQIEVSGICTYTHHTDFFSARRLGINSGRILSGIFIQPS